MLRPKVVGALMVVELVILSSVALSSVALSSVPLSSVALSSVARSSVALPGAAAPAVAGRPEPDPPCGACLVLLVTPQQALVLPPALHGLEVLVEIPAGEERRALAALEDIAGRGGRPGVFIRGVPTAPVAPEVLDRAEVVLVEVPASGAGPDPDAMAYAIKTHFTAARGAAARDLVLGLAAPADWLDALLARDIAPYVDVIVRPGAAHASGTSAVAGPNDWLGGTNGVPVMTNVFDALQSARASGPMRALWRLPAGLLEASVAATEAARAARWLPAGLVAASPVRVRCGPREADTFLDPETLDTIAVARSCRPEDPVSVSPDEPGVERATFAGDVTLIRVPAAGSPDRFASAVDVVATRGLTAAEIVARHQAVAARQARRVRALISRGTLTLSFEAPGFPAPVTVASDTTIFTGDGQVDLEQRRIRVNGMEFAGGSVPRLPIIEPERVASPPLAITLTGVYRYALAGEQEVDGVRCYVLAFEPSGGAAPSFRGKAWIAADGFALVRVRAVQTGLRGAIVMSEQDDTYREVAAGVWLLARSDVRQTYEGAAHRTPIHRVLAIEAHELNPPDFTARRRAAYASDAVMLRDTRAGFRYLRREPAMAEPGAAVDATVVERADRVRTLAAGAIVDPNIDRPLPFAGLSYVDFNLFGTGAQLNAFFGGTYGQLAFSVPSLGGTRWQVAGRAFAIASPYNDRAFAGGREVYAENIRQRPAHASVWVLRPLTARLTLRAGYDLDYTHFAAADSTAAPFAVPADQVVHGARLALEAQRAGWQASAWWNPARRTGWRPWGLPGSGAYDPSHADFQRYGVSLGRSAVLSPRLAGRIEAAWMAGHDLDRFSRYAFGSFDNRLRGYPAALVRYDRGGVIRAAIAWSAARFVRLDGFVDSATVRDRGYGKGLRNYTGFGVALEAPAPLGTLVSAEWGYGLRGVNADGSAGTHVIRVSAFKVF
jgi:hypothetical protein